MAKRHSGGQNEKHAHNNKYAKESRAPRIPGQISGESNADSSGESIGDYLQDIKMEREARRARGQSYRTPRKQKAGYFSGHSLPPNTLEVIENDRFWKVRGIRFAKDKSSPYGLDRDSAIGAIFEVEKIVRNLATEFYTPLRQQRVHALVTLPKGQAILQLDLKDGRYEVSLPEVRPETPGAIKDESTGKFYGIISDSKQLAGKFITVRNQRDDRYR